MTLEPRQRSDYGARQVEAARGVLVDIGQVLASYSDCLVVVGGWTPDHLLPNAEVPHIGSIDVNLALDAARLGSGRYAEMLKLLLNTRRYRQGPKDFQLLVEVDLQDGDVPLLVEIDFLAPKEIKLRKNKPKLLAGFRVLQADGCGAAFHAPRELQLSGQNVRGAENTVRLRVASLPDFLIMKAHAIGGRDKPKDVYDLCYVLEESPGGWASLAADWRTRLQEPDVASAITILREKFDSVSAFGPRQLVEFHDAADSETRAVHARYAYELTQAFLVSILKDA